MSAQELDYAALIIRRRSSLWVREHLVIDYYNVDRPNQIFTKYPGGMSEGSESSLSTAVRELLEETYLILSVGDLRVLDYYTSSSRNSESGVHTKGFFEADWESCSGDLRKVPIRDGNEILLPPRLANVNSLYGELIDTHKAPFLLSVQGDFDEDQHLVRDP